MFLTNCYILADVIPVGEHERHQLHTLNPSQLSGGGTTQIPLQTNNTTTQALVNDPSSPTQQVPITNVIQPNSPSESDPWIRDHQAKFEKPRIGGIASLADPSATSSGSTIIPMTTTR